MGYYGRRRPNPYAAARREREEEERRQIEESRSAFGEFLADYRKIELQGERARWAWGLPQRKTFTIGKTSDGSHVIVTVREDERGQLYLQEPSGGMGWAFYKLLPRYHVPREDEHERDRRRGRRSSKRKVRAVRRWEKTHLPPSTRRRLERKHKLLRREGRPERQAWAMAYSMTIGRPSRGRRRRRR